MNIKTDDIINSNNRLKKLSLFEKYLTLWVTISILAGIGLSTIAPNLATRLNDFSIAQVSIPVAICLFFMMFPIMVKIDFTQVKKASLNLKPVIITLVINWIIKPISMYAIAYFFLEMLFSNFINGNETILGQSVPVFRSYIAGAVLLGIAPCTAMVLMWGYLAKGNDALTLTMVGINSLVMLFLYAPLGKLLLSINDIPIPWQTIFLSVLIYVGLPLISGYFTRKYILQYKGNDYFNRTFLPHLTPIAIFALLATLFILFILKGRALIENPFDMFFIAIPLFIQTIFIFVIGFISSKFFRLRYEDAAPVAMIGASNHFEVAIATAVVLFGLGSGAALATVVGVLIEVPVMLLLVKFCLRKKDWFLYNSPI